MAALLFRNEHIGHEMHEFSTADGLPPRTTTSNAPNSGAFHPGSVIDIDVPPICPILFKGTNFQLTLTKHVAHVKHRVPTPLLVTSKRLCR